MIEELRSPTISTEQAAVLVRSMELDLQAFYRHALEKAMTTLDGAEVDGLDSAELLTGFALMFGEEGQSRTYRIAKAMQDLSELRR